MKLEALRRERLQEELLRSRLLPARNARHHQIFQAVRSVVDGASVCYVLSDTPGQLEDYFSILVDGAVIVDFELRRDDPLAKPEEVELRSVAQMEKSNQQGHQMIKLRIAVELAQQDLERR